MAVHRIEIIPGTAGNPPTVDQNTVYLSKKNNDRVQWWSRSHDWAVAFGMKTPFELHYYAPSHAENETIAVDPGPEEYKYTIFVDGNSTDPIFIVNP